jgi:hypothetical protein
MNNLIYKEEYDLIIQNRLQNPYDGYTENHHILPKCLFPELKNLKEHPENSVMLSAKEHFECHILLHKIYPKSVGLQNAAFLMSHREVNKEWIKVNAKEYAILKEEYSKNKSEIRKGIKPLKEICDKVSVGLKQYYQTEEGIAQSIKHSINLTGKKHSAERCVTNKIAQQKYNKTPEGLDKAKKHSEYLLLFFQTEEGKLQKAKSSAAQRGIKRGPQKNPYKRK